MNDSDVARASADMQQYMICQFKSPPWADYDSEENIFVAPSRWLVSNDASVGDDESQKTSDETRILKWPRVPIGKNYVKEYKNRDADLEVTFCNYEVEVLFSSDDPIEIDAKLRNLKSFQSISTPHPRSRQERAKRVLDGIACPLGKQIKMIPNSVSQDETENPGIGHLNLEELPQSSSVIKDSGLVKSSKVVEDIEKEMEMLNELGDLSFDDDTVVRKNLQEALAKNNLDTTPIDNIPDSQMFDDCQKESPEEKVEDKSLQQ
ncbi:uncharacterized protein LOC132198961 [Neocloeon triangulifer]|uniref:uncharacterized protein LOC132198961 n=1 Tax=Neocloeon triangulifer TaxID=2078957 RepID=UPI00286EC91A|nr:uncharacterized protein LOC132198961 [Neocloeon triangulifer]